MTKEILVKNSKMGDSVLARVKDLESKGDLKFPVNYSPENAMKSAMLQLQELKGSKKKVISLHLKSQRQTAWPTR